jgi:glycosidase
VGAYYALSANFAHAQDLSYSRSGSRLTVSISTEQVDTWQLEDVNGHVCARGKFPVPIAGIAQVTFNKVASDTHLVFRAGSSVIRIPGQRTLSPLSKLNNSARIYQLPVRTYTAHNTGYEHRGRFAALTTSVLQDIKDLGIDYVWLTGVLEQANPAQVDPDVVKGEAGSYYAIYDAWDASEDLGGLDQLEALIARAHANGLRVLIDLIPNHTARVHQTDVTCKEHLNFGTHDDKSKFSAFNNNYYYIQGTTFVPPVQIAAGADGIFDSDLITDGIQPELPAKVTGNNVISPAPSVNDWFETVKLNYGTNLNRDQHIVGERPRTWLQIFDVAQYWVSKGVDGFRVDFAHVVPPQFWAWFVSELRAINPAVYLIAEAYEGAGNDASRYSELFRAGFDSVYHSNLYWRMHDSARNPAQARVGTAAQSPMMRPEHVLEGDMFTHYMENHDELRLASRFFTPSLSTRHQRAHLGLAYTTYLGLLPGNLLIHGGQEFKEDASVFGPYAGDNGRTSIFDWVYQPFTQAWYHGDRTGEMTHFRQRYQHLLALKGQSPFNLRHAQSQPTFYDLELANSGKEQSHWIAAYVRADPESGSAYLIVINSDPNQSHATTVHFTSVDHQDPTGVLAAIGASIGDQRLLFTEVFTQPGWVPHDPNIDGMGVPGRYLFRSGGVPSGLFLGDVPAATIMVLKIDKL